jgi:hypothetical protein
MKRPVVALWPVILSVAICCAAGAADVVVKKDGTRVEGRVVEGTSHVTVTNRHGRQLIPIADVEIVLTNATPLHQRFRHDPQAKHLLLLASRAGIELDLKTSEEMLAQLSAAGSSVETADLVLQALKLTPQDTQAVVDANVNEFKTDWGNRARTLTSKHYTVLTTMDAADAKRLALYMDGIFEEYQKRLVFNEKITDRFVVKVFSDRDEYLSAGAPSFSGAYFSPRDRELVGYRTPTFDDMLRPLYHEGMHQFLHFYVPNPPTWFDEGLAKYFESAKPMRIQMATTAPSYIVGGKLPDEGDYARRYAAAGRLVPLERLIAMSKQDFYTQHPTLNYVQAWAFTHLLVESGNETLKRLWVEYFFMLRDGASGEEANREIFGKVDMRRLNEMLATYTKKL